MRSSLRALRVATSLERPDLIASDLQAVARAYRHNREPTKALEEARKALAVATATGNQALRLSSETFLLDILVEYGMLQEARRCAERALELCGSEADGPEAAQIRLQLAKALLAEGRYHDARPYLVSALRGIQQHGDAESQAEVHLALARVAMHTGDLEQAEQELRSEGVRGASSIQRMQVRVLDVQKDLALLRGNHAEAYSILSRLRTLEDSLELADRELLLAGTQVLYDTQRKDLDNRDLRARNERAESLLADVRSNARALAAAALVLLGLVTGLVLAVLRSARLSRRSRLKSGVIERQRNELHAKSLELERQNMRLRESLMGEEEKDIVLKEIHHRVKNNLQVIDSLLGLHIGDPSDPSASRALREAQGRIRAMGLVHSAIHRFGGENALPIKEHILELSRLVLAAHGRQDSISVTVDVPEAVLHATELMPLSLLINELLTNSLKYAFAGHAHGQVRISVAVEGPVWELRFTDNGDCPNDEQAYVRPGSFGMDLLHVLARQLNGNLSIRSDKGTYVRLAFTPMNAESQGFLRAAV
ncbi:MAG: tetratricopeptide repeat protein [Flavobacteriales bacterium]|nr:tetratricopeptide repeat protein [Flavobacteriales bacterium]